MEPEGPVSSSQVSGTGPNTEPAESNPNPPTLFPSDVR
jgi:hypothetical protein